MGSVYALDHKFILFHITINEFLSSGRGPFSATPLQQECLELPSNLF